MPGKLIICAGPIGNLGDAAPRLAEGLAGANIAYAEDTRRTGRLLEHFGIAVPLRSYFVGNEAKRSKEIAQRLDSGETVALITDAGVPGISDPGLTAVQAALASGAEITVIPGPSAVTAALAVSGLPGDRFVFEGFLPRKGKERRERLDAISTEHRTVVLFAAPQRLAADLGDLSEAAGPERHCVVCRELTKLHEEIWRGRLGNAAAAWAERDQIKGEVTLVLAGRAPGEPDFDAAVDAVKRLLGEGVSTRDAVRTVAEDHGVSRRRLYQRVVG